MFLLNSNVYRFLFFFLWCFLRNGQNQNTVFEGCTNIFLTDIFADEEASLACSDKTFSSEVFAFCLLFFRCVGTVCADGKITIFQFCAYILFCKSRKINIQEIVTILFADICLHHRRCIIGRCRCKEWVFEKFIK